MPRRECILSTTGWGKGRHIPLPPHRLVRTRWGRSTKTYRKRLTPLLEAMAREAEEAVERGSGVNHNPDPSVVAEGSRRKP